MLLPAVLEMCCQCRKHFPKYFLKIKTNGVVLGKMCTLAQLTVLVVVTDT